MIKRRKILQVLAGLPLGWGAASTLGKSPFTDGPTVLAFSNGTYSKLGVRPLINARGTVTIVGATRMLPEVKEAMDMATREYVQLDELMEGVGQRIAELTGAEWGCVTAGASAAITAGTLGCLAGGDPDKIWQIPDLTGLKDEVIIPSYSRTAYECAARATGVRMIEVSDQQELESAIGPRTAMIMILTGLRSQNGPLSLREIAAIAGPRRVPVLADAAAEELVVPNPHLQQGADLVTYSGGKCLRGPQCAGILIGREDLVRAAWLANAPHHGFARGQKVGREEIMGMLAAVEMWFQRDHQKEQQIWNDWLSYIAGQVNRIKGVSTHIEQPGERLSNHFPVLRVEWETEHIPFTGHQVENQLWDMEPRIAVSGAGSYLPFPPNFQPFVTINPSQLEDGEEKIIADGLVDVLTRRPETIESMQPAAHDLSGQWSLEIQFAASEAQQTLFLSQEENLLSGSHIGSFARRPVKGTIEGDEVLIRSSYTKEGVRLNFEFKGNVTGDTMEGMVSLGEYGTATWKAHLTNYR